MTLATTKSSTIRNKNKKNRSSRLSSSSSSSCSSSSSSSSLSPSSSTTRTSFFNISNNNKHMLTLILVFVLFGVIMHIKCHGLSCCVHAEHHLQKTQQHQQQQQPKLLKPKIIPSIHNYEHELYEIKISSMKDMSGSSISTISGDVHVQMIELVDIIGPNRPSTDAYYLPHQKVFRTYIQT